MNTIEKLNAYANFKLFTDWDDYLQWMMAVMNYNSEQITDRIITAMEMKY